jgi:hypothetical protein
MRWLRKPRAYSTRAHTMFVLRSSYEFHPTVWTQQNLPATFPKVEETFAAPIIGTPGIQQEVA